MNAIVTVIGQNRVGIIAAISMRLAEYGVDILDVSQTILNGSFTMVMVVNLEGANASFVEIRDALAKLGEERQLSIRIQRQEIFEAMHTV